MARDRYANAGLRIGGGTVRIEETLFRSPLILPFLAPFGVGELGSAVTTVLCGGEAVMAATENGCRNVHKCLGVYKSRRSSLIWGAGTV
jgi:hypothetical protein